MPNFKKKADCPFEGDVTITGAFADVVVPASGTVSVDEATAAELRLVPYIEEADKAAKPAAPTKESK